MATVRILCITRTDSPSEKVILHVSANNDNPLDLTLTATEGAEGYLRKVTGKQLDGFRDPKSRISSSQWNSTLQWLLLHKQPGSQDSHLSNNVELVATVSSQEKITLIVRQNIGGITTRQGSIPIDFDEDAAIELYDWNVLAISSRDAVESDVETLRSQRDQQQRKLEELEKHLSEIIEAKKRHEDELLEKFRHLLNAKKSKIRDQMRLLATVKVDTATAKSVRSSRGHGTAGSTVNDGTTRKRKLERRGDVDEDEDLDGESEPKMADEDPDTDPDARRTPEPETEDETDVDTSLASAPSKSPKQSDVKAESQSQRGSRPGRAQPVRPSKDDDSSDSGFEVASQKTTTRSSAAGARKTAEAQSQQASNQDLAKNESPPPPRTLPFKNTTARNAQSQPTAGSAASQGSQAVPAAAPDDDTTDDDEL